MSFRRYESYRHTGVEWLGAVPSHWPVQPLKTIARFTNGEAFKPSEWVESGTPIIRIQNLNGGSEFNCYDGVVDARYHVRDGDLLFGWSGNRGTSFGPFKWTRPGVHYLNQHIFKVDPRREHPSWLYWCLKAVTEYVEQQAHGIIGMVHVTQGKLGAISVPVPNRAQQAAIAAFLDRETAKIDALVEEQRRLIELLKEKRQAVICHAVTKGIDYSAPMKDSGVEWLGEVPAHWELGPLKRITTQCCDGPFGSGLKSDHYVDVGVRVVRLQNITGLGFDASDAAYIDAEYFNSSLRRHEVQAGDVLIAGLGDERNVVGRACVAPADIEPAMVKADCFRFRLDEGVVRGAFAASQLNASAEFTAGMLATGSTRSRIALSTMMTRVVALPPLDEQSRIVAAIERQIAGIACLSGEAERATHLLQERRAALITAAVTGKIDVRDRAIAPAELEPA